MSSANSMLNAGHALNRLEGSRGRNFSLSKAVQKQNYRDVERGVITPEMYKKMYEDIMRDGLRGTWHDKALKEQRYWEADDHCPDEETRREEALHRRYAFRLYKAFLLLIILLGVVISTISVVDLVRKAGSTRGECRLFARQEDDCGEVCKFQVAFHNSNLGAIEVHGWAPEFRINYYGEYEAEHDAFRCCRDPLDYSSWMGPEREGLSRITSTRDFCDDWGAVGIVHKAVADASCPRAPWPCYFWSGATAYELQDKGLPGSKLRAGDSLAMLPHLFIGLLLLPLAYSCLRAQKPGSCARRVAEHAKGLGSRSYFAVLKQLPEELRTDGMSRDLECDSAARVIQRHARIFLQKICRLRVMMAAAASQTVKEDDEEAAGEQYGGMFGVEQLQMGMHLGPPPAKSKSRRLLYDTGDPNTFRRLTNWRVVSEPGREPAVLEVAVPTGQKVDLNMKITPATPLLPRTVIVASAPPAGFAISHGLGVGYKLLEVRSSWGRYNWPTTEAAVLLHMVKKAPRPAFFLFEAAAQVTKWQPAKGPRIERPTPVPVDLWPLDLQEALTLQRQMMQQASPVAAASAAASSDGRFSNCQAYEDQPEQIPSSALDAMKTPARPPLPPTRPDMEAVTPPAAPAPLLEETEAEHLDPTYIHDEVEEIEDPQSDGAWEDLPPCPGMEGFSVAAAGLVPNASLATADVDEQHIATSASGASLRRPQSAVAASPSRGWQGGRQRPSSAFSPLTKSSRNLPAAVGQRRFGSAVVEKEEAEADPIAFALQGVATQRRPLLPGRLKLHTCADEVYEQSQADSPSRPTTAGSNAHQWGSRGHGSRPSTADGSHSALRRLASNSSSSHGALSTSRPASASGASAVWGSSSSSAAALGLDLDVQAMQPNLARRMSAPHIGLPPDSKNRPLGKRPSSASATAASSSSRRGLHRPPSAGSSAGVQSRPASSGLAAGTGRPPSANSFAGARPPRPAAASSSKGKRTLAPPA
eukprot:TRINITY_DN15162_c0_g1_i1.p1 TRINITY_DN15162_c0_g1~~TRINITY_DN15162_c0_g1_i1.p1  ORF type:complete len:984 (+),score=183.84 TRINITY_DN15162_c0_g1_i1:215-3166(+)